MFITSFSIKALKHNHLHHYLSGKNGDLQGFGMFWHPSELSGVQLGQLLSLGAKTCNEHNSVSS